MGNENLLKITKDYYNHKDTDQFYYHIWGGEDIHIGWYKKKGVSLKEASLSTTQTMARIIPGLKKSHRILDIGSGYGGTARYLAAKYGCKVDCLDLSEGNNRRNSEKSKAADLDKYIAIQTGNFEEIPFDSETYDIVWSQDALLHSNNKTQVFREVARVLKPQGRFIFTDPMQQEQCPEGALAKVLERIHLQEMGSIQLYKRLAKRAELEQVLVKRRPQYLITHYQKVLETLQDKRKSLAEKISPAFLDNMELGLQAWIEAGEKGYLDWGILQFQKRNY